MTPTWDLFLAIFIAIGVAYGIILQRDRIIATLTSIYLSLVITLTLSDTLIDFFQGNAFLFNRLWIPLKTSPFTITTGLFIVMIVLLSAKGAHSFTFDQSRKNILGAIEVIIYSALSTGLIISTILSFMAEDQRSKLLEQSVIASKIFDFHDWWIVLPVFLLIISGFRAYEERRR